MAELDALFDGSLDDKMDFLDNKSVINSDGIYRVDLSKVKDKSKGYKSVIRLLPNLKKDGTLGQTGIEKISHYVNLKDAVELSGYYDSPKNFNQPCTLSTLYYKLRDSKNAVIASKAELLNYSRRYYSYALIIEDEQQPELVGKIMILQYGKTIKDKINIEKTGEISGQPCNVFSLDSGKDMVYIVKETKTGERTYPNYDMCTFREQSSLPIFKDGSFKNVPLDENGKIEAKYRGAIKKFLLERDHDLEEFAPKLLTEEEQSKISEIVNLLTGKASSTYETKSNPTSDDFSFDEVSDDTVSQETVVEEEFLQAESEDDDDFFDF